mmetsp:Transcript_9742/g.7340  ORF Transcript_9742/g.7340 Transcript_9742/m.7340 type:complete len:107 (-) Transcript_9742:273-593(-)
MKNVKYFTALALAITTVDAQQDCLTLSTSYEVTDELASDSFFFGRYFSLDAGDNCYIYAYKDWRLFWADMAYDADVSVGTNSDATVTLDLYYGYGTSIGANCVLQS